MPYIHQNDRIKFDDHIKSLIENINNKGELTYCLYTLMVKFFRKCDLSYTNISSVKSSGQDATDEFTRKYLNPYEDRKIKENGDI